MMILFNLLEQEWFLTILGVVGTALAGLITYGVERLVSWLKNKTRNDKLNAALDFVAEMVNTAVVQTNQTFVDQLKKDGEFNKHNQEEAFRQTMEVTLDLIPKKIQDFLGKTYGDLDGLLTSLIESAVSRNK